MFIKVTIFCICIITIASAQDEISPWEKLGLSKTEWMMIQENKIPMSKVAELLKAGIGIGEYVNKTWIDLGLSEEKWLNKRRSGLTNEEIRGKVKHPSSDISWKDQNRDNAREDFRSVSKNGEKFSSLFLPGYQQHKNGRKVSGNLMLAFTGASLAWCTAGSIYNKRFEFIPIFFVTVPTMVWSFTDCSAHSKR
jgi:hypothetical protein